MVNEISPQMEPTIINSVTAAAASLPSTDPNQLISRLYLHGLEYGRFGYAYFETLRIRQAGVGYRLGFNATGAASKLEGAVYVESEAFTVGVGPAHRLELENDIFAEAIVSSSPFKEQVWCIGFLHIFTFL